VFDALRTHFTVPQLIELTAIIAVENLRGAVQPRAGHRLGGLQRGYGMCATGLIERFEEARARLRAVAYRMLGSVDDAEDAVQEAWLRLSRNRGNMDNVDAWLTTVVARICLNMLRARRARREEELLERLPDPLIDPPGDFDPEHQLLADSVGLALFVVLDTVPPAERLAFVLHDVFAVPFDEIASIVDRSPRPLAS
jgi:RNA polymerase sigma factor (sigma-70 family)